MVLLVHPNAERVLVVDEDGSVFRPVSVDVCSFVEPVALLKGPLVEHGVIQTLYFFYSVKLAPQIQVGELLASLSHLITNDRPVGFG